ncbi:MAG: carbamoyltransferase HypF [Chloroflexota bacterium]
MRARDIPASSKQRLRVEIRGAVQGVGFRPFVYRLAAELALTGWVINDSRGVFIEVEGPGTALTHFLARLPADKPPRAIIHGLNSDWLEPVGYSQFEIRHSDSQGAKTVLVLPDIATCADCLAEIFDPADRRDRYPFTNCTNCGPRFSIIQALPYDRPNTTMRRFVMCPACQAEYENPLDRRFHAQPNACPVCGPKLALYQRPPIADGGPQSLTDGSLAAVRGRRPAVAGGNEALRQTAAALKAGQIVAVKGLGGFHLMVDAANAEAIARLRERKPRRDKPLAVMVQDLAQARSVCEISAQAEAMLASPEAPIVLLPQRPGAPIAGNVAPGNPNLGIMLPYTPLHHLLLRELGRPIIATSGNLTDEPICTDEDEAVRRLGHIADLFLVHNRPIERHVDDSVAWLLAGEPQLLRRARGYAPLPVLLRRPAPPILAVGAHLKNTVALSVERQVFISQHIGDLETAESMAAFERVIADFLRLYEARPVAVAHDLHPDYLSTRWTQENFGFTISDFALDNQAKSKIQIVPVQHHHAHLAACLAENGVDGPALGVIWDGTGYGLDGAIWGGEFLQGDAAGFSRAAHLRPFRLPGGDAAVKEPRRVALALLWELYGESVLARDDLAPIRAFQPAERRLLAQMLKRGFNSPLTTSAGRLFDGIAALLGLHQQVSFEGQAAMALEFAANRAVDEAYPFPFDRRPPTSDGADHKLLATSLHPSSFILDWGPLVEAVLADLQQGIEPGIISARFHNALVDAIVATAGLVGERRVALSGGCFQNRLLAERVAQRLSETGFEVLLHRQVPPNDGGISLGQIAVAAARFQNE